MHPQDHPTKTTPTTIPDKPERIVSGTLHNVFTDEAGHRAAQLVVRFDDGERRPLEVGIPEGVDVEDERAVMADVAERFGFPLREPGRLRFSVRLVLDEASLMDPAPPIPGVEAPAPPHVPEDILRDLAGEMAGRLEDALQGEPRVSVEREEGEGTHASPSPSACESFHCATIRERTGTGTHFLDVSGPEAWHQAAEEARRIVREEEVPCRVEVHLPAEDGYPWGEERWHVRFGPGEEPTAYRLAWEKSPGSLVAAREEVELEALQVELGVLPPYTEDGHRGTHARLVASLESTDYRCPDCGHVVRDTRDDHGRTHWIVWEHDCERREGREVWGWDRLEPEGMRPQP